jgi:ATP-dependent Lon protease
VRNLEREIGRACRKVATQIAEGKSKRVTVRAKDVSELLGNPRFFGMEEVAERTRIPGVAAGLAWTPTGGDVLFIEATAMPGGKEFKLTGSLGEVMRESALAALSYVRSVSGRLGISDDYWKQHDIHLHIPAGSQPKDGPSAGITMAAALASLATGRPVRGQLGMTGEITLRGKVLPIGGVKEKVLAAHRASLKRVILPERNKADLEEVPEEVKKALAFVFVDTMDDVLQAALADRKYRRTASSLLARTSRSKPASKRAKGKPASRRKPSRPSN